MGRHSCCVKQKLRKGLWSPEEDEKLFNYITIFGVGCWSSVPKLAGLQRCGKSCRLRWINYLRPDLKRGMFSQQEEDLIIRLHEVLGNRWAQIAAQLPGRTDNEIKNFWNSCLKKKLLKQGIDPNTHKPITEDQKKINCTDKAVNLLPHSSSHEMEKTIQINSTTSSNYYFGHGEIESSRGGQHHQQLVSSNKQVFDPLFLVEFQASINDPCGYQSNFLNQCQQNIEFEGNPDHSFNSLPNLTTLDHRNIVDHTNRSITNCPKTIQMLENASAFSWDSHNSKFDSVFQYQFNGMIKNEDDQEGQLQAQNSGDFSNYPILTSLSAEYLSGTNVFDVFHPM